jgi:hypothetical protein
MNKLLVILFLFTTSAAFAAPPDYIVYFVKGKVVKTGAKPTIVKKGDQLLNTDQITLAGKAQVVLITKEYVTVQLQKTGTIKLNTLTTSAAQTSLTSGYFRYIWSEFTSHHDAPEKNPMHYMKNKGAVSRGMPKVQTAIDVDTIYYSRGHLPVYWKSEWDSFYVNVYNDAYEGKLLYKEKLSSDLVLINEVVSKLQSPGIYYWQVTNKDGWGDDRNYLQLLDPADYRQRVDALLKNSIATTPAETAYLKGYILEENHFQAEAFQYYQKAFQLAPQNSLYQKSQNRFYEFK